MSKLHPSVASLVAGKELADLTCIIPGLFSAEAFLNKIVVNAIPNEMHETSLMEAVNNAPVEWKEVDSGNESQGDRGFMSGSLRHY